MAYERNNRRPDAGGSDEGQAGGRRRYTAVKKTCPFCEDKDRKLDYKDADAMRRFLNEKGKIKARRKNGTCALHQRAVALAIKRSRHLALLPFTTESVRGG